MLRRDTKPGIRVSFGMIFQNHSNRPPSNYFDEENLLRPKTKGWSDLLAVSENV